MRDAKARFVALSLMLVWYSHGVAAAAAAVDTAGDRLPTIDRIIVYIDDLEAGPLVEGRQTPEAVLPGKTASRRTSDVQLRGMGTTLVAACFDDPRRAARTR